MAEAGATHTAWPAPDATSLLTADTAFDGKSLPAGLGLRVESFGADRGRGLVAERPFACGEVLFREEPMVACQFGWNEQYKYLACDYCLRSMEPCQAMARRLTGQAELVLPYAEECCPVQTEMYRNCDLCEKMFCSNVCLDHALRDYHHLLCSGRMDEESRKIYAELNDVWLHMHFPPETTNIDLLVRCLCLLLDPARAHSFAYQLEAMVHETHSACDQFVHKLLSPDFADQIDRLHQLLSKLFARHENLHKYLSAAGFRSLLAIAGRNQQGIGSSSFSRYVHNLEQLSLDSAEKAQVDELIDLVYEQMHEVSGEFLDVEGVGLYRFQSLCNHSCVPNVEVTFPHGNHTLALVATQDINAGEEICISYLSECLQERSRHSRQKFLRENYLFECQCSLCIAQKDDPDVTSEEEEEEDGEESS